MSSFIRFTSAGITIVMLTLMKTGTGFAQQSPHGDIKIPCEACHSTNSWEGVRSDIAFDHSSTGFPLEGQHKRAACIDCHKDLRFTGLSSRCTTCHTDIHKAELGPDCLRCHTLASWKITDMVQKHQATRFPLLGKHSTVTCESCHSTAASYRYAGTPIECIGCHRPEYQNSTNPNHVAAGFSTDCTICHSNSDFTWGTSFDHARTIFPLTGAHRAVPCISCHPAGNFTSAPTDCYGCHAQQFAAATNPNHVAGNFSHACTSCHTTTAWQPSTFDHSATKFPLLGAHKLIACSDCHINNQYTALSVKCIDCHQKDFVLATNPNHTTAGFSQDCTLCHSYTAWTPATFDHSKTKFPLTGAHTSLQCQACHTNNNYQLTYLGCFLCHSNEYNATTNPNHTSAGFPKTCETCHSTTSWSGATFNHTWFPTNHGGANGVCASCHTNASDYSVFQCTDCHTQAQTDPRHREVSGYVWNSANCYQCHRNGGGGD